MSGAVLSSHRAFAFVVLSGAVTGSLLPSRPSPPQSQVASSAAVGIWSRSAPIPTQRFEDGIEVTRELGKDPRCPPIVICSVETDPAVVQTAREAGALGYVFKVRVAKDLILAVNSAVQGKPFVSQPLE